MVLLEDLGYLWGSGDKPTKLMMWKYTPTTLIYLSDKKIYHGTIGKEKSLGGWISSEDFIRKMKPERPKQPNLNKRIIDILEGELSGK